MTMIEKTEEAIRHCHLLQRQWETEKENFKRAVAMNAEALLAIELRIQNLTKLHSTLEKGKKDNTRIKSAEAEA